MQEINIAELRKHMEAYFNAVERDRFLNRNGVRLQCKSLATKASSSHIIQGRLS